MLRLDGANLEWLALPAPTVALTSLALDGVPLARAGYVAEGTASESPDRRFAPRLLRVSWRWSRGRRNVVIVGTFGFFERVLASPPAIVEACLRLALRNLPRLTDADEQAERRVAAVFMESTDGHGYQLGSVPPGSAGAWRLGGLTGDLDIDRALERYRRSSAGGRV